MLNNSSESDPAVRESLIVDASNRFFTLIPSIHPHVIRDEDGFNAKVTTKICSQIFISLHVFLTATAVTLSN